MRWLTRILIALAVVTAAGRESRAAEPDAAMPLGHAAQAGSFRLKALDLSDVGAGGQSGLPDSEGTSGAGRRRGRQRQPGQGVEVQGPGTAVRPLRAGGDGVPLPAWLLEVEPRGASAVQPGQPQLGWQAAAVPAALRADEALSEPLRQAILRALLRRQVS
jgi:hypothetical protein